MDPITLETSVEDAVAISPAAADIFAQHGCVVDDQCPAGSQDLSLEAAEIMCGLEDLPGLIAELNALLPH